MSDQQPEQDNAIRSRAVGSNAGLGKPLSEGFDVKHLRAAIDFLWNLLDDIDTASDIAKADDKLYRAIVEAIQCRRHELVTSDGCSLFMVPNV